MTNSGFYQTQVNLTNQSRGNRYPSRRVAPSTTLSISIVLASIPIGKLSTYFEPSREFAVYLKGKGRLKTFKLEAVRAGFSSAWKERDYPTILHVAERLPARVFEDDPQLMLYADNARLRADALPNQEKLL